MVCSFRQCLCAHPFWTHLVSTQLLLLCSATLAHAEERPTTAIDYTRDVRPILADTCFRCHGPDAAQREGELRLDVRRDSTRMRDGYQVVVPGRPATSHLLIRIKSPDNSLRMPPPDAPRQLSVDEIRTLEAWIRQGAPYEEHWAFEPPQRRVPPADTTGWSINAIDRFILAQLKAHGLAPAPRADNRTLIRRVTLDLTGLPPSPDEVDAFVADESPDAYERLVNRLLNSPRFGEHMAVAWMDLARYADSGGYQGDIPRTMWPWRNWVIRAYNDNMPFDQFTIEQLAGDLLPAATSQQIIATGFNRNHRINDEDGIIPEEFRVEYVIDRVETTSATWLGLTMGCARCHDHKYDPISQREFYSFFAYFNNVAEYGRGYGNSQPLYYFDERVRAEIEDIDARLIALGDAAQGEYQALIDLKKRRDEVLSKSLTTMVMQDLPTPRVTHVLKRGLYDQPTDVVNPGTPQALSFSNQAAGNRRGLAEWLVDSRHPLTSRVAVNRFWEAHFGVGFVETPEDFGVRCQRPEHLSLLDWLATEFTRRGWDVKALQRLIVTSATYQQSSKVDVARFRRDPQNRLLSRGPRLRLAAEVLRDQALAAAGLLDTRVGGPSVKPYQPDGIWDEVVGFFPEYEQSHGRDLYRRSLYTYIRRTVQPPAMNVLDLPSRETCQVRRLRTNTPLQALVTMNDPTYVEAARVLAARTMANPTCSARDEEWMAQVFDRVLSRAPRQRELQLLKHELGSQREQFAAAPAQATAFVQVGEAPCSDRLETAELAARTALVSLILNLDETLNRE